MIAFMDETYTKSGKGTGKEHASDQIYFSDQMAFHNSPTMALRNLVTATRLETTRNSFFCSGR